MENKRKSQIAIIAVLAVAVVALGVGFAAFSTALTITSSASVTPDDSTFRVVFADNTAQSNYNPISGENTNPVTITPQLSASVQNFTATDATIDNTATHAPEITGLSANFTAPGQSVTYTFKVKNIGEYDAFLNSINFQNATGANSNKVCTADVRVENQGQENETSTPLATQTYVDEACGLISLSIQIHGSTFTTTSTPSTSPKLDKSGNNSESTVIVTIAYAEPAANAQTAGTYGRADGPFTVAFGDIQLNYSTVANS